MNHAQITTIMIAEILTRSHEVRQNVNTGGVVYSVLEDDKIHESLLMGVQNFIMDRKSVFMGSGHVYVVPDCSDIILDAFGKI